MISIDKIKIFRKYHGDIDFWARSGSKKEKLIINDNDWYIIDTLIQDMLFVRKGLSTKEFKEDIDNKLKEICSDQEVIKQLTGYVNQIR
jgi:hypothetical protein